MNPKVSVRTGFLFATPSFGSGVARALDLYGRFDAYNTSASEDEADNRAIANDWRAVGEDLISVMDHAEAK